MPKVPKGCLWESYAEREILAVSDRRGNRPDCRLQNERGNSYTETTDFHRFHGRRGRRYTQIMRAEGPEGMPLVHPFGRVTRRVLEHDAHDIKRHSRWANSNQPGRVTCS